MSQYFQIKGTEDRTGSKYNYILCVNEKNKRKLGKFAVVEHQHKNYEVPLRAYGRVLVNNSLKDDEVMMDQTLRIAVAISYNNDAFDGFAEKVKLYPLRIPLLKRICNFVASKFAIRYIYCRYNIPNIIDVEKELIRISEDTFELLGCVSGDNVVCEFPAQQGEEFVLRSYSVQAYTASANMIEERKRIENDENDPNNTRYLSVLQIFQLEPDIPRIFIDYHIRERLGTEELEPIAVRREIKGLFLKQIMEFGIVLMITLITTVSVIPGEITWRKLTVTSVISLGVSILLVLLNIRSALR
jgi:hypothetical protein